ncbi:competence/damage-inducible protein A [Bacteroidota bacterium]
MCKTVILTIGNEILNGKTLDTNAHWISNALDNAGFRVYKKISVGDSGEEIFQALKEAEDAGDIVLITGGLGPTKDDITKKTLAGYFDSEMSLNQVAYDRLQAFFTSRGFKMTELNRQQAIMPDKCTVIPNKLGTAQGMWFEKNDTVFISMPGVPHEMKNIMTYELIPLISEKFKPGSIIHKMIHTAGIGESWLADRIHDWEKSLSKSISVAYLPQFGFVSLRLTASGGVVERLKSDINNAIIDLNSVAGPYIFGYDDDNLESVIGRILTEKGESLAVAESCTGGHIGHIITSVPGSSAYFAGGIIAYSNMVKREQLGVRFETLEKFGAVSEETVGEMAMGVKNLCSVDYALATSGIAGPDGGTSDKPVGTVCIGLADKEDVVTQKLNFVKDRMTNIRYTTNRALTMLWERLKAKNGDKI